MKPQIKFVRLFVVSGLALLVTALILAAPGDLDTTFGEGGVAKVTFEDFPNAFIAGLERDAEARLMLIGTGLDNGLKQSCVLARLNLDGVLDTSFSFDGKVALRVAEESICRNVISDASDGYVVVGSVQYPGIPQLLLARYLEDGTLDSNFGDNGVIIGDFPSGSIGQAVDQPFVDIFTVAGFVSGNFMIAQYEASGSLDSSFGELGGYTITDFGDFAAVSDMIRYQNDEWVVVGTYTVTEGILPSDFAVARYSQNGIPDNTFSDDGRTLIDFGFPDEGAFTAAYDSLGRLIIVGLARNNVVTTPFDQCAIARLNPDGTLDLNFDGDGKKLIAPNNISHECRIVGSLEFETPRKMLVVGTSSVDDGTVFIARLNDDGSFDTTFGGGDGITYSKVGEWKVDTIDGFTGDEAGRLLVGAEVEDRTQESLGVLRFDIGYTTLTATPETSATPTSTAPAPTGTLDVTATPESPSLVENGGFEAKDTAQKPDLQPWTQKTASQDKIKCNKTGKPPVTTFGECAYMFKGSIGENSKLSQNATLPASPLAVGDTLTLRVFAKGENPSVNGRVKLRVKYGDDSTTGKINVTLAPTTGYQEFVSVPYPLVSSNVSKIKVQIDHKSTAGKVYVDDIRLNVTTSTGLVPLP
jgi:uncharacterized delta-60 repeat protein